MNDSMFNESMDMRFREFRLDISLACDEAKSSGRIDSEDAKALAEQVNKSLEEADLAFILQWISYMRDQGEYLNTHSLNVGLLNGLLGRWLKLPAEDIEKLVFTGLFHDVGKARIADKILDKPDKLTKEEFDEMKKHPLYSYEILKASGITDDNILKGVKGHHEKVNGNGYPEGLTLEDITLFGRITSISDIYDAMAASKSYKAASTPFEVLHEFSRNKFSELDIRLVDIFLNRMASEMAGREVVLSDGRKCSIVFADVSKFAYPVVKCGEEIINTSKELRCETLCPKTD